MTVDSLGEEDVIHEDVENLGTFSAEEMVALRALLSTNARSHSTIGTADSTITTTENSSPEVTEALLQTVRDDEDEREEVLVDHSQRSRRRSSVSFHRGRFAALTDVTTRPKSEYKKCDEDREVSSLPQTSFSLLIVSNALSVPFATAIGVFLVKVSVFALIITSLYTGDETNPFDIPASQTGPVIVAQFVALLITVLTQDDMLTAFSQLHEGLGEDLKKEFPKTTSAKFYSSIVCQIVSGTLGMCVTFLLIITATDVISLMLDFTAVEFVTLLDNGAFPVAQKGFLGVSNRNLTQAIIETEFYLDKDQQKIGPRYQTIILFTLYLALVAGWSVVYSLQATGKFMPNYLVLQFDDDMTFQLSTLSGPYKLETNRAEFGYNRIRYYSEDKSVKIGYCEPHAFWTIWKEGNDPCNNNIARSTGNMFSFNVLDVADDPWYATSDVEVARFHPMNDFQILIGCDTDEDCGGNSPSVCSNDRCKCGEGYFSLRCDFEEEEVCSYLELDGEPLEGFASHSTEYTLLTNSIDEMIQFYHHPVFTSNTAVEDVVNATGLRNPDIIFYSGWRWILTRTHEAFVSPGQNVTLDNIAAFLESGEADVNSMLLEHEFFMSDPVAFNSPGDASSPIGLNWYLAHGGISSTGDISSEGPFPSTFFCGICDNVTNPCQFEGRCLEDGDCICGNGSSGTLCRVAPLSDGLCDNSIFNSDDYNWDGGDCCLATCRSSFNSTCGVVPVDSIESVYVGFPYCMDPDSFCDASPCYAVKSDTIESSAALSEMRVTLSSSGRLVVVSEPSIDTVRVFDQADSRWLMRGSPLEGVRNTNFGQQAAIAASPPSALMRTSGHLPVVLAIASGVSGQAHASVFRFAQDDGEWSALGEKLDLCETAGLEECSLHSLEVVFHHGVVRLLSVLIEEKVIVMATNLTTEGNTELLDWDIVVILDGSEATISEKGEHVAAVVAGDSTVRIFELDRLADAQEDNGTSIGSVDIELSSIDSTNTTNSTNSTVPPTYETDLGLYGYDTTIRGLRMSPDGAFLTAVLWKDGSDGVLIRVPSSVSVPSLSPTHKPTGSVVPTTEPSMLPSYEPTMSMFPSTGPSMSIFPSVSPSMNTTALNVSTAPSFLPSLPPTIEAYTAVEEYDPQSVVRMASDGTSVCFLIASQFIRAYDYDATSARWNLVGGEMRITELERQFDIASGGKTLVVGGLSPIVAYQNRPACPDGWRTIKISLTLSDMPLEMLQNISWKMQSIQMAGNITVTTNSLDSSCVGCYDDYDKFAMAVISEEVCVPSNECLVFNFHASMGFDDGYGMVLLDGDEPVAVVEGNSTDPIQIVTSEGEACRLDVMECNSTDVHLLLSMTLDGHPEQTSWYLTHNESILAESGSLREGTQTYQLCVPADSCLSLTFEDTFDNGFCCGAGNGQYSVWLDEELVLSKSGEFGASERVHFGSSCDTEVIESVVASLTLIVGVEDTQGVYWTLQEQSGVVVASGGELPQDSLPQTNMTIQEVNVTMPEINGTLNGTAAFAMSPALGIFGFGGMLADMIDLDAILASRSNATNSTLFLNTTNFVLHPGTNYEFEIFSPHFYMLESDGYVLVVGRGFSNETSKHNFTAP